MCYVDNLDTNRSKLSMSFCWTSRSITMGCWHGLAFSSRRKYGLQAESTTLCAVNEQPSHASVTSTKSSSSRRWRNEDKMDEWKSFHRSEYCCSGEVSPPIGHNEGAISTPMVKPLSEHRGDEMQDAVPFAASQDVKCLNASICKQIVIVLKITTNIIKQNIQKIHSSRSIELFGTNNNK